MFPYGYDIKNPPGESYNGIRALADLSVCVKNTNKLSSTIAGEMVAVIRKTKFVLVSFLFKHG
jgi:hypothetical protein